MRYEVLVKRSEFITVEADSMREAVHEVLRIHPDARARAVDSLETDEGSDVIANCEGCNTIILSCDQGYQSFEDGLYFCQECIKGN